MAVEFAVFLPRTKSFNVLAIYCSRAYGICNRLDNFKMMAGGHAVHKQQAIL